MIPSADLRAEVLERLELLGRGKSWTASHVAGYRGEKRSVSAVWRILDDLLEEGIVLQHAVDRFYLPEASHVQTTLDVGA